MCVPGIAGGIADGGVVMDFTQHAPSVVDDTHPLHAQSVAGTGTVVGGMVDVGGMVEIDGGSVGTGHHSRFIPGAEWGVPSNGFPSQVAFV